MTMGGGKGKKTLKQNEQLIFKTMLQCKIRNKVGVKSIHSVILLSKFKKFEITRSLCGGL